MERSLAKKRKELDICNQELEKNPLDKVIKEKVTQLQHKDWLFEDTIHRVKEDIYHQRQLWGCYKSVWIPILYKGGGVRKGENKNKIQSILDSNSV